MNPKMPRRLGGYTQWSILQSSEGSSHRKTRVQQERLEHGNAISIEGESDSNGTSGTSGTEVKISTQPYKGTRSLLRLKTRDGDFLFGEYREGSILETEVRSRQFPTMAASRCTRLKDKPVPNHSKDQRSKANYDDTSETRRTHIIHDGGLRTSSDEDLDEVAARKVVKQHPFQSFGS